MTQLGALATALELGEPPEIQEVLNTLQARKELVDDVARLETAALLLNARAQRIALSPRQALDQASRFGLAHQAADGDWVVLTRSGRTSRILRLHQHDQSLLSVRGLQRLLGSQAVSWLAFEPPQVSPHAVHLSPLARLRELLRPEHHDLGLVLAYSVGMGVLGLVVPITIQALVNNIAFGTLLQPLLSLTFVVLLVLGLLALMRSLRLVVVEMLQRRVFVRVTEAAAEGLMRILPSQFEQRRLPEVVNRFFDIMTVQKSASFLLLDGLGLLLQTLTGMALLAFYHPFFLVFDLGLLVIIAAILLGLGRWGQRSSIQESGQKYKMAAWLEELATHPQMFRNVSGQQHAIWRTETLMQDYLTARERHFTVVLRQNVAAFALQAFGSAALLGLGGWLVIQGELTLGQLVAAELIVAGVLDSFSKLGKHLEVWYDLMAALDKLGYLYDLPQEPRPKALLAPPNPSMGVRLENMSYRHPQHLRHLSEINFDCPPGCRLALYTEQTWEASVLLELLYGLRQPDQGLILIDGQSLNHLLKPDYRSRVALVRDVELLEGSLLDNLRLGRRDLSRAEARGLLEQVGLWETVCRLADGMDTALMFNGLPLTLEDARRLMIARALAMNPALLLIDGTLDDLGWQRQGPLARCLLEESEMTLIVRTRLPEMLQAFDRVYTFEQGALQEHVAATAGGTDV